MEIVKVEVLKNQFRKVPKSTNSITATISKLQVGEALVVSAKEADRWKNPSQALRSYVYNGYKTKNLNKTAKYTVNNLKSGSYAVVRISK